VDTDLHAASLLELLDWYAMHPERSTRIRPTERCTLRRLREALGRRRLSSLTDDDFVGYAQARRRGHHADDAGQLRGPCAPSTLNIEISFFSRIFAFARRHGWPAPDAACIEIARARLRGDATIARAPRRERMPTDDELARLRRVLARDAHLLLPLEDVVEFIVCSARTLGETLRLRWADVDLGRGVVYLRSSDHVLGPWARRARLTLDAQELLGQQPRGEADTRVFPFAAASMTTAFRRACLQAGIDDLQFRDLRRLAIARLLQSGRPVREVAAVAAYSKLHDLRRYMDTLVPA
jgi:integrase